MLLVDIVLKPFRQIRVVHLLIMVCAARRLETMVLLQTTSRVINTCLSTGLSGHTTNATRCTRYNAAFHRRQILSRSNTIFIVSVHRLMYITLLTLGCKLH